MTDLQKQLEDGQRANEVLENPVFKAMAEEIRSDFARAFKGDDEDKALEARREIRVFEAFLTKLVRKNQKGLEAAKKLDKLNQRKHEGLSTNINDVQGIA